MSRAPLRPLRAVGFWFPPTLAQARARHGAADPYVQSLVEVHEAESRSHQPFLPSPDRIIEMLGPAHYDERVPRYLESGCVSAMYLGFATCRCCARTRGEMGSSDLTDGEWVWPQGLAHYVRVHSLPLPDEFLDAMRQHDFRIPRLPSDAREQRPLDVHDYSFWYAWSAKVYGVAIR